MAPVKAPFSWPNNSLSSSPVGMAAQLSLTKARWWRRLWSWMARAMSSLPVPVSPQKQDRGIAGRDGLDGWRTCLMAGLCPTI